MTSRLSHFQPKTEIMVLSHFLDFGWPDRLQIAHNDLNWWCLPLGQCICHVESFNNQKNAFLDDPNSQKWDFWLFSRVWSIRLSWNRILWWNSMVCMNGLLYSSSYIIHNCLFWMIQIAKNELFGHFLEFGPLERLDIAYCYGTKWYAR